MATNNNMTVVGVFDDHETARRVVQSLKEIGFTESEIGLASAGDHSQNRTADGDYGDADEADETFSGEGAMTGAVAGAGAGALWGLGILAGILPAIGPAIAGGTLAVLLSSAAAAAAAAGLGGALLGMGLSKAEAEYYESEMKAGRTIVTVQAGSRREEATSIIKQYGGYDIQSRDTMGSQATNRTPSSSNRSAMGAEASSRTTDLSDTQSGKRQAGMTGNTVQAHEERINIRKTPVETGEVTVRKEVHTDHKTIDVPVTREEIVVERRSGSGARVENDSLAPGQEMRIPVRSERVDVQKETVVSEEVNIGKRRVQETQTVDETLRKEEIKIEERGDVDVRDKRDKRRSQ